MPNSRRKATLDPSRSRRASHQVSNRREGVRAFLGSSLNRNFVLSCRLLRRVLQRSHNDPRAPFGRRRRHPSPEHGRVVACSSESAGIARSAVLDTSTLGPLAILSEAGLSHGSEIGSTGLDVDVNSSSAHATEAAAGSGRKFFGCTRTMRSTSSPEAAARPRLRGALPCTCPWVCICTCPCACAFASTQFGSTAPFAYDPHVGYGYGLKAYDPSCPDGGAAYWKA